MIKRKVAVHTLGCKVNQQESEAMVSLFKRAGYLEVDFHDLADVYIINTCSVTHLADRKSRQMIRRAINNNPLALVAVTGCYAQTAPGEILDIPGVKLVVGTADRQRLVELVEAAQQNDRPLNVVSDIMQASRFEDIAGGDSDPQRVRAYLKIQEGCSQFCAYCIIPYARGPLRSSPLPEVIQSAEKLVRDGFKEIVLTGIHTGAYGAEAADGPGLADLIQALAALPGLARLRISSIDPNEVNDRLLDLMASSPVLCPHLHIPLQSGDDSVLRRMNRIYTTADYAALLQKVRGRIPGIALTTDIMVGFPGETAENFANTLAFTEKMGFSALHVFKYSPRRGTPAADFPDQLPGPLKESRSQGLISLGRRLSAEYAEINMGSVVSVLVEEEIQLSGQPFWSGHTGNYLKVAFTAADQLKGSLVDVCLVSHREGLLFGQQV